MIFWNVLVSHRICHFRAIKPFDLLDAKCKKSNTVSTYHVVVYLGKAGLLRKSPSMTQTSLGPKKFVPDMSSLSH